MADSNRMDRISRIRNDECRMMNDELKQLVCHSSFIIALILSIPANF
jgi:hypothetical protein